MNKQIKEAIENKDFNINIQLFPMPKVKDGEENKKYTVEYWYDFCEDLKSKIKPVENGMDEADKKCVDVPLKAILRIQYLNKEEVTEELLYYINADAVNVCNNFPK